MLLNTCITLPNSEIRPNWAPRLPVQLENKYQKPSVREQRRLGPQAGVCHQPAAPSLVSHTLFPPPEHHPVSTVTCSSGSRRLLFLFLQSNCTLAAANMSHRSITI